MDSWEEGEKLPYEWECWKRWVRSGIQVSPAVWAEEAIIQAADR